MSKIPFGFFIIFLLFFSSCYTGPELPAENPAALSYSSEDISRFTEIIKETLDGLYWKYDAGSMYFEDENLIFEGKNDDRLVEMEQAAASIGLDMSRRRGEKAAVGSINLLHNNNEPAGRAKFFFSAGVLICAYYSPAGDDYARFGLRDKNAYLIPDPFRAYENETREYPRPVVMNANDFGKTAPGVKNMAFGGLLASIKGESVIIHEYKAGSFDLKRELTFGGLVPIDFAPLAGGGLAVLLGERGAGDWDGAKEFSSVKINIYDDKFSISSAAELGPDYTAVASSGASLLLANGRTYEFYDIKPDGLIKRSQAILTHWASRVKWAGLAGGGPEIIIADGVNIYIYRLNGFLPQLIWRSHAEPAFADFELTVFDLNGDGVSEIYLTDGSPVCTRYLLTRGGLRAETADDADGIDIIGADRGDGLIWIKYVE